jgi:predicted GNAT family acetyltransferase
MRMDVGIEHVPGQQRFNTVVDGVAAHLEYQRSDGVMTITHTIVPPAIGGRGIAGSLVKAALDHARAEGLKVDPRCSYSGAWMHRHPEYQDLRA